MKVLLVSSTGVVEEPGGVAKVLCCLANELIARGHEVDWVCLQVKKGRPYFYLDARVNFVNLCYQGEPYAGLRYLLTKPGRELSKLTVKLGLQTQKDMWDPKRGYFEREFVARLQDYIKDRRPDIILADFAQALYLAQVATKGSIPTVGQVHSSPDRFQNLTTCEAGSYAQADVVQVLMPSYGGFFTNLGAKRIETIPNVVEQVAEDELVDLNTTRHTIINVAKLVRNPKRHYLLLEAFGQLARRYPDWRLVIYGEEHDARYTRYLRGIVERYDMQAQVVFAGVTKDVQGALRQADFFVFPSAYEGFPLALTEALSVGLPAIGYKACPAVNELIEDGVSGLLCEEGVEALREAMETLILRQDLRIIYGRNAHEAMKRYAPQVVYDQWEALLKETVAAHKARQVNSEE